MKKTAWFAAWMLCLVAGCSKKGPECQSMVGVINPAADAMMRASASKGGTPADQAAEMRRMATVTKGAADNMGKLEITVPDLKKVQTEYQALYGAASKDSTALAEALDGIAKAGQDMDKVGLALKTAIDKWGELCMGDKHPDEAAGCKGFADAMKSLPKDPTDKAGVEKSLAEMDKVTWKGDELKAASKNVRDAYAASTKQIGAMQALGAKAEGAEKSFKEIETKEQALIDGFNKFCKE